MDDGFLKLNPEDILNEVLNQIEQPDRVRVSNALFNWFVAVCRKKPVADLPARINKMKDAIAKMCEVMTFKAKGTTVLVEVVGSAETTFQQLMYGSDWFDGHPRLADFITEELFRPES